MSKFKTFLLALFGLLAMNVGTLSALSSADFFPDAAAWSYRHCRSVSPTDEQQNMLCFLLKEHADHHIALALQKNNNQSQQSQIDALESGTISKSNTYKTQSAVGNVTTTPSSVEAFCEDENDVLLSGGYTSEADKKMHVVSSQAGNGATASWVVEAFGEEPSGFDFQAFANCYRVD